MGHGANSEPWATAKWAAGLPVQQAGKQVSSSRTPPGLLPGRHSFPCALISFSPRSLVVSNWEGS